MQGDTLAWGAVGCIRPRAEDMVNDRAPARVAMPCARQWRMHAARAEHKVVVQVHLKEWLAVVVNSVLPKGRGRAMQAFRDSRCIAMSHPSIEVASEDDMAAVVAVVGNISS